MTEYLQADELASYLGVPESDTIAKVVELTNALIDDEWTESAANIAIPARVTNLAWTVAVRAGANPKGLSSWTRSWDDISRTERMEAGRAAGVYLTDDERGILNGVTRPVRKVGSIRLSVPGWS